MQRSGTTTASQRHPITTATDSFKNNKKRRVKKLNSNNNRKTFNNRLHYTTTKNCLKMVSSSSSSSIKIPGLSSSSVSIATVTAAFFYVMSGVTQPLIMTVAKDSGLADSGCQLYMLFYTMGPASVTLSLLKKKKKDDDDTTTAAATTSNGNCGGTLVLDWPFDNPKLMYKTIGIAFFDLFAQMLNYTGAAAAGPTIFAIIYSSVTVWTALFSFWFLKRQMSILQWIGVFVVFIGLTITAVDSSSGNELGPNVRRGCAMVMIGSMLHASVYVLSEAVMTVGGFGGGGGGSSSSSANNDNASDDNNERVISVQQNASIQGTVSMSTFFIWQLLYTLPRFQERIWDPMQAANTTIFLAIIILLSFAAANLIHALAYFYTLKYCPGGATSAGVMKGLQAVLVFVATNWIFCGTSSGGEELCFTTAKFISLLTVVTGLILYGVATEQSTRNEHGSVGPQHGYTPITNNEKQDNNNYV